MFERGGLFTGSGMVVYLVEHFTKNSDRERTRQLLAPQKLLAGVNGISGQPKSVRRQVHFWKCVFSHKSREINVLTSCQQFPLQRSERESRVHQLLKLKKLEEQVFARITYQVNPLRRKKLLGKTFSSSRF